MSIVTSLVRLGNGGGQAGSVHYRPLCPQHLVGSHTFWGKRVETRDAPSPHLGVPADSVLGLPGYGLNPFCPALTDVLISQAGRRGPLGMNFWGPMGSSFSGTKTGKPWAVPAAALWLWGPHLAPWVALGSELHGAAGLGSECRVSLAPGIRLPSPSRVGVGQWASVCIGRDTEIGLCGR